MSIVEKAAEKLKALQPERSEQPEAAPVAASPAEASPDPYQAPTIERLHDRASEADQIPEETAPLWPVDYRALERAGLRPTESDANDRLADELRRIKRPLLANAVGKRGIGPAHPERIAVTSASSGEGKTFTAMNLAMSLAREPDFEVLLVDGDIPKADITRVLGLHGRPGLMDVLANEQRRPGEVIVRTDIPNLSVVPVGERHPLTAELFGSLRMQYVLEELGGRDRRRLLVFDSSPLLVTSESQALVAHMGQIVMVVAAARTPRHAVSTALQNVNDSQYVGMVLNMSRLPATENYYDSYYGQYPRTPEGDA